MSLKAKIEAVIYAAEEPVMLAQLAGLFGHEVEAELRRQAGEQAELPLIESGDSTVGEVADDLGAENEPPAERPDAEAQKAQVLESTSEPQPSDEPFADSSTETAEPDTAGSKREERERARRVREFLRSLLDELVHDYAAEDRGLEIREVAGGFRLATKPEYHDAVRGFARTLKPPLKLTLQALETLAVVAYKQPVTAPEVSEIRGVDSGGVLGSLMARKLVTTAGRKQVIGRPILYKTTKDFLLRFGLKDIGELPSIQEFEKMAGELAQEEIPMADISYAEAGMDVGGVSPGTGSVGGDVVGAGDGGGSIDNLPAQGEGSVPQADGDSGDGVSPEDAAPLDGRLSGLDPADIEPGGDDSVDSPALDAEIQSGERSGS